MRAVRSAFGRYSWRGQGVVDQRAHTCGKLRGHRGQLVGAAGGQGSWGGQSTETGDHRHRSDSWMEAPIGPERARKSGWGAGRVGRSQAAEPAMGPLATGSWWLTARRPGAKMEIAHLLTKAE